MFLHRYRRALSPTESTVIRMLRRRGFAVVIFEPTAVGHPLNRGKVEKHMRIAGEQACRRKEDTTCS